MFSTCVARFAKENLPSSILGAFRTLGAAAKRVLVANAALADSRKLLK